MAIFPSLLHSLKIFLFSKTHRVGGNRKHYQQSTNAEQKSIETVFSIATCRQWGDKRQSKTLFQWGDKRQSKTLFLSIFLSTFLKSIGVFDCRIPGVKNRADAFSLSTLTCRILTGLLGQKCYTGLDQGAVTMPLYLSLPAEHVIR